MKHLFLGTMLTIAVSSVLLLNGKCALASQTSVPDDCYKYAKTNYQEYCDLLKDDNEINPHAPLTLKTAFHIFDVSGSNQQLESFTFPIYEKKTPQSNTPLSYLQILEIK